MMAAGKGIAVLLVSSAAVLAPPVAGAEPRRPPVKEADAARATMRIYATCLVAGAWSKSRHAQLIGFLTVAPQSDAGAKAAQKLSTPDCLSKAAKEGQYVAMLRFKADLIRGELFRALYLEQVKPPAHVHVPRAELEPGFNLGDTEVITTLQRFGDCVVAANPTSAAGAISPEVGSEAETHAYRALGSALGGCLPTGASWRFSRAVLEGVLAEALYKRATAPAAG